MRTIALTIALFFIEVLALRQALIEFAMKLGEQRDAASKIVWSMMFENMNVWTIVYAISGLALAYIVASFIVRR